MMSCQMGKAAETPVDVFQDQVDEALEILHGRMAGILAQEELAAEMAEKMKAASDEIRSIPNPAEDPLEKQKLELAKLAAGRREAALKEKISQARVELLRDTLELREAILSAGQKAFQETLNAVAERFLKEEFRHVAAGRNEEVRAQVIELVAEASGFFELRRLLASQALSSAPRRTPETVERLLDRISAREWPPIRTFLGLGRIHLVLHYEAA